MDGRFKHGMAKKHPLYSTWIGMRQRCNDKNHVGYKLYGAVGVTVCKEWDDFLTFASDMGQKPDGCTLDRIDSKKGYNKQNCRWATNKNQVLNRSMTVWLELDGVKMCLNDWAKHIGISTRTLKERLKKWDLRSSLTTKKLINGKWQHERNKQNATV